MKKLFIVCLAILSPLCVISQYLYQLKQEKISVNSPIELQNNSSESGLYLEGNGIKVEISTLGGMEGISGLDGSLSSYASSFYQNLGKVQALNELKNLKASMIEARKDGKPVILCMFATSDYKKHYICEISFTENQRKNANFIVKSIAFNEKASSEVQNIVDNPSEITNENNNVINENQSGKIEKGSLAPDFTLKNVNGGNTSLSSLKGKTLLLDFWGTWCKPCIQLIPKLKEIYSKYGSKNFELLSIANDNNMEKWKNMVSLKGMNWTNVIDLDESVTKLYKISAFPTLILIDENGKIVKVEASEEDVEEYLGRSGKKPVVSPKTSKNTQNSGTELEKMTWSLLSKYSPDGYSILDEYFKSPSSYQGQSVSGDSDFTKWIDGTTENDVVKSLNTVVHEMCHGYTGKLYLKGLQDAGLPIENASYSAFYLGNNEMKVVKHTKVFVTKEINSIYPEQLKTSRYETYVYPSEAIMGSQQSGIYGLLDELNAYYNGTKTSLDLYNYYSENQDNVTGWLQFFSDFYGTYYAYLEFKSYMIFYMQYAEKNYKDIYSDILANKDFVYAFRKIDENWNKLIVDFINLKANLVKKLKDKGIKTSEKNGFTYMNGQGVGNFSDKYQLFQTELKNAKYQKIAQAMGLNSAFGPELGF
jgi:thiol-disulfide isomerase/thioredoxin